MHTSLLSRSVIAVATLGIGSVALAAVPATAATPSGITRDQVLTATNGVRVAEAQDVAYSFATEAALSSMIVAQCGIAPSETVGNTYGTPTQSGGNADGLLVFAYIQGESGARYCEFGAVATADPTFALAGASTISGKFVNTPGADPAVQSLNGALSGDVAVTPVLNSSLNGFFSIETTFTAAGNAAKTTTTQVTTKVADKKTKSEKKAAKKKHDKKLKAAKKSYKKALSKAGNSKSKKAKAKKAYSKRKAAAKAAYKKATAGYKNVTSTVSNTENRPFSLSAVD